MGTTPGLGHSSGYTQRPSAHQERGLASDPYISGFSGNCILTCSESRLVFQLKHALVELGVQLDTCHCRNDRTDHGVGKFDLGAEGQHHS